MGEAEEEAEKETPVLKEEESLFMSILSQKNYVAATSEYLQKPFKTVWQNFWKLKDAQLYFCGCFFPFVAVFVALFLPFIAVVFWVAILLFMGYIVEAFHQLHVG